MKKKINLLFIAFLILINSSLRANQDSVTVSGNMSGIQNLGYSKVQLTIKTYFGENKYYSSPIDSDYFVVKVPLQAKPAVVNMVLMKNTNTIDMDLTGRFDFYLFNENIRVDGNIENLEATQFWGGEENEYFNKLRSSTASLVRESNTIRKRVISGELDVQSDERKTLMERSLQLSRAKIKLEKEYISQFPNYYMSLYLLSIFKMHYTSDDYALTYNLLGETFKDSKLAKSIESSISKEMATRKGVEAIDFSRTTSDGQLINLSDFRGKVVLLDFWGSWCGPCRASMPHLLHLYNQYKDKGFVILGIAQERGKSLEDSQKSWRKAIDDLGIHWVNVLNNENTSQDIVTQYSVNTFPTKILVDTNGKIILRISGSATDDIDIKLKEIFN